MASYLDLSCLNYQQPIGCHPCALMFESIIEHEQHIRHNHVRKVNKLFLCPVPDCAAKMKQLDNLMTHYRSMHTKAMTKRCPDCSFVASDPARVTRHRKKAHYYNPKTKTNQPPQEVSLDGSVGPERNMRSSNRFQPWAFVRPSSPFSRSSSVSSGLSGASVEPSPVSYDQPASSDEGSGLPFPFGPSDPWMSSLEAVSNYSPRSPRSLLAPPPLPCTFDSEHPSYTIEPLGPIMDQNCGSLLELMAPVAHVDFDFDSALSSVSSPFGFAMPANDSLNFAQNAHIASIPANSQGVTADAFLSGFDLLFSPMKQNGDQNIPVSDNVFNANFQSEDWNNLLSGLNELLGPF